MPRLGISPVRMAGNTPWVLLTIKEYCLPAILDSGSSSSFIRRDVFQRIQDLGLPCWAEAVDQACCAANGQSCVISQAVLLPIKLHSFSWKYSFLIFEDSPVPCILGADFLAFVKMQLDFSTMTYTFAFDRACRYDFERFDGGSRDGKSFPCSEQALTQLVACASPGSPREARKLDQLVRGFPNLFSGRLGTVKGMVCELELVDDQPVRSRPYQCSPPRLKALRGIVDDLLREGVVRKSTSHYASPAFLIPKSSGEYRMVVDYRLLNKKVRFDAFPMPSVEQAFANFPGAKVFSILDLNSAYYQLPLSARSRKATAFSTPFGLFEFTKLPMGISVGCQILSRVVDSLFGDLKHQYVYNFMDDLLVYSCTVEDHLVHLEEVFRRLEKAGFTLNRDKMQLMKPKIKFLGHSLSEAGVEVLPERIEALREFPPPNNLKAVRRFLGMIGFYGNFVKDFSRLAEPLHALKRKNARFVWGEPQRRSFEALKEAISTPPVLQVPDFEKEFVLVCDASDMAVSAVLNQRGEAGLAPIAFASRLLSATERKYSTYEKECLAVVWGCERFRVYLEHTPFILHTDNQALSWLLKQVRELGRIGRWVLRLAAFKFTVVHVAGKANVVADCLTRQYERPASDQFSGLVLQHLPAAFLSIREHQIKDPHCREIYNQIRSQDPAVRNFRLSKETIVYSPVGARRKRYLVPSDLRSMVLEYFHDSALGAHLGVAKTLFRISRVFYWPGIRSDVSNYVRGCQACQKAKPAQSTQVGLHHSQVVSQPMERIFMDFVGPMVRSRQGNVAILVILDGFSKFVAMYPVRRICSDAVVKVLTERYFPSFGLPHTIVSDNATVFRSRRFHDTCFSWGIKHVTTSPYYPQASQVERFNRNLKAALTIYHHSQHPLWDEHLPMLTMAFNSAWHESTGTQPAVLFLGRELNHPLGLRWEFSELDFCQSPTQRRGYWEAALKNLKKARERVAKRYNALRKEATFRVGDLVMVRVHPQSSKLRRRSAKLELRWSEPLVVAKYLTEVTVELANPDTGVIVRKAHVSQLKRYFVRD